MRSHGVPLDDSFVDMLCHTYYENALVFVKSYSDDAKVNGLAYDRYEEELTVHFFRDFLHAAWEAVKGQQESTSIPSWSCVVFGLPDIHQKLLEE